MFVVVMVVIFKVVENVVKYNVIEGFLVVIVIFEYNIGWK